MRASTLTMGERANRAWGIPSLIWLILSIAVVGVTSPAAAQDADAGVEPPAEDDDDWGEEDDDDWGEEDDDWGETDPEEADPEEADPEEADPEEADPEEADPEEADPEEADPEEADPEDADPEEADPEEADPEEEAVPDAEVGSDDESVTGQEGGLLPPNDPVQYRPAPDSPSAGDFQLILPPVLYERSGDTTSIATFPLFYYRESPDATEFSIPPYYLMRGRENWDVIFPFFWWYRGEGHHTWAIPPVWSHSAPDGFDFGVAPFVMAGRHGANHYTLIPPLLTLDWGDEDERYTLAALFWRVQEPEVEHWGLFPFLWVENAETDNYTLAPPFYFRFQDEDEGTELTVIPPLLFYHRSEPNGSYWGIPPLVHHNSGPDHTSTTIFPLLSHYSEEADAFRLVLGGVFWYWQDHGDETVVTPLYQRFRGATEMDAVAPFFFYIRDPRTDSVTLAVPPLVWHFEDPASVNTVVFPFFGRFEERGRQTTWLTPLVANHVNHELGDETTWVFPTIQVSRWHDGDAVNIHPIWYFESTPSHRHSVLAPFWWDFEEFEGDQNRYTVLFPFFWRIREGNTTSTLVMNVYHRETVRSDSSEWEFHIFPFFSYGEYSSGGHWWKIFYGLAGYERRGQYGITTLAYIPFQTDGPPLEASDD